MGFKFCVTRCTTLLLPILLIGLSAAKPATTPTDDFYVSSRRLDSGDVDSVPLSSYRLNQLRRGYYFVDDGYITAVAPSAFAPLPSASSENRRKSSTRFKPLVQYKQTKTKRKKLFVPNLFG